MTAHNFIPIELARVESYAIHIFIAFETVGAAWCGQVDECLENVHSHAAWRELDRLQRRIDELRAEDERLKWLRYWLRVASWQMS